ncbi:MAG TPA: MATE family efflux transporter [Thermotogota bacterium]|nr:MATE family efflux transporter [Thermotogota bacterium]
MNKRTEMLEIGNIVPTLLKLSVPAMIGMLVGAAYNIVDTIFIGRGVGSLGIAGLGVAFPVQSIIMSIGLLFGLGGASVISRALGAKDHEKAQNTFGSIISMLLITSVTLMIFGEVFLDDIMRIFGATDTILPFASEYMRVILVGTPVQAFIMCMNNVIRSEGNAKVAMNSMLISALINIALDPIFIFALNMGIRGAAVATVIAQVVTALYQIYYFMTGKSILKVSLKRFKPKGQLIREVFALGSPSFVRNASLSVLTAIINNLLATYGGDLSIAVYGIITKLMTFSTMSIAGFAQGMLPLLGYNYGAKLVDRAKKTVSYSVLFSVLSGTFLFIIVMIWTAPVIGIFTTDRQLIEQGIEATRIVFLTLPVIGIQIIGAGFFQAIGKALPAMFLSLSRQILFLIPLVYLLSSLFGLTGIWYAFVTADVISTGVTAWLMIREYRHFNRLTAERQGG